MRVTKAALVQECEHLRRMLSLEIQTASMLRGEIAALKAERVTRAPTSTRGVNSRRNRPASISEMGNAARRYCEVHGVKSVTRAELLAELCG